LILCDETPNDDGIEEFYGADFFRNARKLTSRRVSGFINTTITGKLVTILTVKSLSLSCFHGVRVYLATARLPDVSFITFLFCAPFALEGHGISSFLFV
jgi:hypothetical protein